MMLFPVGGEDPRKATLKADGGTCFHLAARELNLSALHIFKALGCQLDGFDSKHRTPLMVAIIGYGKRVRDLEGQVTIKPLCSNRYLPSTFPKA